MPGRVCTEPGCPDLARPGRSRCDTHDREREAKRSAQRREATKGIFKTKRWRMLRRQVLTEQSVCNACNQRLTEEIDHIIALQDGGAPYDRLNVQGLCAPCHRDKHRPGAGGR